MRLKKGSAPTTITADRTTKKVLSQSGGKEATELGHQPPRNA
jgi:hypothetical protein